MTTFGEFLVGLGVLASFWATIGGLFGGFNRRPALTASAARGIHVATLAAAGASLVLIRLLLASDFSVAYVWKYTSSTLGTPYKIAALWAGQEGSLLFWVTILGILSSWCISRHNTVRTGLATHMIWVLGSIQLFFLLLISPRPFFNVANPFQLLVEAFPASWGQDVIEGNGLNPQLQNYWMVIHPPMLYLGYVGFAIPFAFAIAALVSGKLGAGWIRASRVWTMTCWTFLGFGIFLGGRWAYVELGWGGYWAWDPVENASFMPWLAGTAFIHSVIIEEQRGMLRRWNIFLVMLTFLLSIFGTFLTRSGIVDSVHSFAQSGIGDVFIYFMAGWFLIAAYLFFYRFADLKPRRRFESIFSRESAFLFQNLFLIGICAAVMWGTLYPSISEWVTGERVTVTAPYFNRVIPPIGLALFFLIGAGPLISWRAASWESLRRNLGVAAIAGFAVGLAAHVAGTKNGIASAGFGIGVFIIVATLTDVFIVARARQRNTAEPILLATVNLIERNRRRYGGFLAHIGMALLLIGLAGNAFNIESEAYLSPGEAIELDKYRVVYDGHIIENDGHRDYFRADVRLFRKNDLVGSRHPEISVYFPGTEREIRNSEVDIHSTLQEDAYLIFADADGDKALIRIMINPLITFFWIGGLVTVLGSVLALVPWRFPRWKPPQPAIVAMALLVFTAPGARAAYSHAIGNRDPVSQSLTCQCGCNLPLDRCDMANCHSSGSLLDELSVLRSAGFSDAGMIDEMVKRYSMKILNAPPKSGLHWAGWIMPFALTAAGGAALLLWLMWKRAEPEPAAIKVTESELATVEEALRAAEKQEAE